MTNGNHFDVIIIGSGAGGGALAWKLAPSGKRILLLERGDFVPREKDNWSSLAVVKEAKYNTKESWRDRQGKPLHPHTNYYVGGNTKFYGAALFRLRERDFGELRHHGGISPAWPISYRDFEPYYAEAERVYHVHGERGLDPTEPWAKDPYPHPAVSHELRIQQLAADFERLGLHPFKVPLGIMLDEQDSQSSKCIRCSTSMSDESKIRRAGLLCRAGARASECQAIDQRIRLKAFYELVRPGSHRTACGA